MRACGLDLGWIAIVALVAGCDLLPGAPIQPGETDGTGSESGSDEDDPGTMTTTDDPTGVDPTGVDSSGGESESDSEDTTTEDTGPIEDHCTLDGVPALTVGHGGGSFVPFEDEVGQVVYGPQGGFHIDIALRAAHMDLSSSFISQIRGYLDGVHVATGNGGGGFVCDPATLYPLRDGIQLRFEIPASQVHGQTFLVEAELTDSASQVAMAVAEVDVWDPAQE